MPEPRSRLGVVAWFVGLVLLAGCRAPAPPPDARQTVRIPTGAAGGIFYPIGQAMADSYRRRLPDVDSEVLASSGAVVNLDSLARGNTDLAFSFADVAYGAYASRGEGQPDGFNRLRAITLLQLEPLQFVAAPGVPVSNIGDLRGRKAVFG